MTRFRPTPLIALATYGVQTTHFYEVNTHASLSIQLDIPFSSCDSEMAPIPVFDEGQPGATVLWFGIHEGKRFDEISEASRRGILGIARQKPYLPNVRYYGEV